MTPDVETNMKLIILICYVYSLCHSDASDTQDITNKRDQLLRTEALMALGGKTTLTDKEAVVNNCIMRHKFREWDYAFDDPRYFNFSRHYFYYKDKIRDSKVYKIIKDLPKGAALHMHDMGILGPDYLMNITYMDKLHVCFEPNNVHLKFSNSSPNITCSGRWQLMSTARGASKDKNEFDANLRNYFTLVVDDPEAKYPSIKESWETFMRYFSTVAPMLTYRPVWEQYFYDVLKAFREQNILYVEVRSILPNLYELDGTEYEPLITAKAYSKIIKRFVKDYPDFIGAKLIYAPPRKVDHRTLDEYLQLALKIKRDMPEHFAGFDLVGQEDLGNPLVDYLPQLTKASKYLDFFFHAGETDWYGCLTDQNLVDAILLGAKRIGHAYALPKHPVLMQEVVHRDIGLEVNLISNTVLSLVRDVRNHPLSVFLAQGLPVVLSSDDPGAWEADPISEDFYVAFVGVASKLSDLRLIKELALNSLKYSAIEQRRKTKVIEIFKRRWDNFVDKFNCSAY